MARNNTIGPQIHRFELDEYPNLASVLHSIRKFLYMEKIKNEKTDKIVRPEGPQRCINLKNTKTLKDVSNLVSFVA